MAPRDLAKPRCTPTMAPRDLAKPRCTPTTPRRDPRSPAVALQCLGATRERPNEAYDGPSRTLLAQAPLGASLRVLDLEAGGGQLVADLVARRPVLVGFRLLADGQEQVDGPAEGFRLGVARGAGALVLQAEQVKEEELERLPQFFQIDGRESGLAVFHGIDGAGGVEEVRDHDRRIKIVVHRVVTLPPETDHVDGRVLRGRQFHQVAVSFHQAGQSLLGGAEGVVAEIDGAAVVGLEDEETDRHRRVGLFERRMIAGKELVERNEIAKTFAHLLPVDGDHVVVHPIMHHLRALRGDRLGDLTFVVRENQVHAAPVDIEMLAEVFLAHRRALAMPAGETIAPGRGPAHDVLGLGLFPKGEVDGVALLVLPVERTGRVDHVLDIAPGKHAVTMLLVVFLDVEIDGSLAHVSEAIVQDPLDQPDLLDDMARGARLDAGREDIEGGHRLVVAAGVILRHLHRLQLLEAGFLGDLVLAVVGVVLQMADVGDVADIPDLIAEMFQIAEKEIESDRRTGVPQMGIAINGRPANIHPHVRGMERDERFLLSGKRVVNIQLLFHRTMYLLSKNLKTHSD